MHKEVGKQEADSGQVQSQRPRVSQDIYSTEIQGTQQRSNLEIRGIISHLWGKFHIVGQLGKMAYKLELPPKHKKFHPVFYISLLKPYYEVMDNPNINISKREPIRVKMSLNQEVEIILAD